MCQPEVITRLYLDVLRNRLGMPAEPGLDGDVVTEAHGVKLVVQNSAPHDPEYLRVFLMSTFDTEPGVLAPLVEELASRKGVKASTWDDTTVLSYEGFVAGQGCVPSAELLASVLPRILDVLLSALSALFTSIELAGIARASGAESV